MAKKLNKKAVEALVDKVISGQPLNNAEKQMINAKLIEQVRAQAMKIRSGYSGAKMVSGGKCSPK